MPCEVDTPYQVVTHRDRGVTRGDYDKLKREYDKIRKIADKLTHENDTLRGEILAGEVDVKRLAQIKRQQIAHRKEDLKRLERTFTKSRDRDIAAEARDGGYEDGIWNYEHEGMIERGLRDRIDNPYRENSE